MFQARWQSFYFEAVFFFPLVRLKIPWQVISSALSLAVWDSFWPSSHSEGGSQFDFSSFFSHIFLFKTTISTIPQEVSSSCFFTHGQPGHQQDAFECWTQRWSDDERAGSCVRSMVGSQRAHLDEVFDHQRQPDFVVDIFLFGWFWRFRKPDKTC